MLNRSMNGRATPLVQACILSVLAVVCAMPLAAQVSTADILGTVTDSSGAVLVDAKITVENPETNLTRTATTNSSGNYVISLLPAGRKLGWSIASTRDSVWLQTTHGPITSTTTPQLVEEHYSVLTSPNWKLTSKMNAEIRT